MTGENKKTFRVEIVVDPPMDAVKEKPFAYIYLDAECENRALLEWFLKNYQRNLPDLAYTYGINEVDVTDE